MQMYPFLRSVVLATLLMPLVSFAVTLGEARVSSFLNQPLDAEIDLIGLAPGQHQDLRVRIANQRHFDRLGIVYEHFLSDLSFDIVQSGSQWLVRARTIRPVTEPFIDFPVQMTWPGGQLIKQYTLLLDPVRQAAKPKLSTARRATAAPTASRTAAVSSPASQGSASYGPVRRGETLWPIAKKLRPRGITTKQMAMALLRANPQAFINGNINRLRAGAILTVPPIGFVQETDAPTARDQFAAQTRRWQAPVATSPREVAVAPGAVGSSASASTGAKPDTPAQAQKPSATDAAESLAKLRIVTDKKPDPAADDDESIKEQLLVTMEEIESNRITTGAIESRLARLEEELSQMQQLVSLKDAQIAALQTEIAARDEIDKAAVLAEPQLPAASKPDTATQAAAAPAQAPTPVPAPTIAKIEPVPVAAAAEPRRAWYDQYLWVIWAVLAALGLAAIMLMIRRPAPANQDVALANLPDVDRSPSPYAAPVAPAKEEIKQAERDFRTLASEPEPQFEGAPSEEQALPELDVTEVAEVEHKIEGLTNSLLDEMLENDDPLEKSPAPAADSKQTESEFTEDDIASWVEELGAEVEQADATPVEARSANDEQLTIDDDIPSILTELDDQLSGADAALNIEPVGIELDPLDEPQEDDTFSMSLDLARAYLEIGDQEGARDMLKQALTGARNPEHRVQIEELLQQIH